jgi:hypothetical protein
MADNYLGPNVRPIIQAGRPARATAVGAALAWFKDCIGGDPLTGTALDADWHNDILENLRSLLTAAGPPVLDTYAADLLLRAVQYIDQKGTVSYAADAGAANTLVVTLAPAPTVYTTGMRIWVKVNATNTGAATINVNGIGAKSIKKITGGDPSPGELFATSIVELVYDGTNFLLLTFSSVSAGAAGSTVVEFNSGSGNFVVPAGVFFLHGIELVGGGGGGGGAASGVAAGGGNGGFTIINPRLAVVPGQSIAYSVGGGGSGGAGGGNNGGNGTQSTFHTYIAKPGKGGISTGAGGATWDASTGPFQISGQPAWYGVVWSGDLVYIGGHGGASGAGGEGGNGALNGGTGGNPGITPGGGGGGGSHGSAGGVGAAGRLRFMY